MPSFESDLKMRWTAAIIPVFLLLVVLFMSPRDPYTAVAAILSFVGAAIVIAAKLIKKYQTKKLVEWGDSGMSPKVRKGYSFGYILLILGLAYSLYSRFVVG